MQDPLHGSFRSPLNRARAEDATRRAQELLDDEGLTRLLTLPRERHDVVPRAREVFVNRNLRMSTVDLIGFDMDYTLAIYHMRRLEQLSFDMTLAKLITEYGYPMLVGGLLYDHHFVMRGLAVDRLNGNILKMDRFGHVGRAYHGLRPLKPEVWRELYRNKRVRLRNPQFAWNDTLFALPETCLFAGIIELLESLGQRVDYGKLYDDIREAIDTIHRDNSLKREVRKDLGRYVFLDPELGPALHKLRSGGNLARFEELTEYRGENILYVGDHIYGDILKSKKSSLWRTCMIVQEIEDEITYTDSRQAEIGTLSQVEVVRERLDDEVNHHKTLLNTLERRLEREPLSSSDRAMTEELRKQTKFELDRMRRALKDTNDIADTLEQDVEEGFNPYWGLLFKEGNENSRFGYQVEQYACLYTSRVSNFLHHSPMQYYRSPRDKMPHEQAGALSARLSPMGGEGPPKGAGKD